MRTSILCLLVFNLSAGQAGTVQHDICAPYVEVRYGDGFGSGTVLKVKGKLMVLTAAHVVEDAVRASRSRYRDEAGVWHDVVERKYQPVKLVKRGKEGRREWRAEIVLYSPPEEEGGHDLALLRPIDSKGLEPAKFDPRVRVTVGMECWYIGTPNGLHASLEKTIFNQIQYEIKHLPDHAYYVVNGHGTYGNSGGGVFIKNDGAYVLVGVVVRIANWPEAGPKHCLACERLETIERFLRLLK